MNVRPDPADPVASRTAHLASRYGTEARDVLTMADGHPELLGPLVPGLPYLAVEALWAVRREMARSVSDVLDRRTQASFRDARAAADAAPSVAALIGPELGWDAERAGLEADAYAAVVRGRLTRAGLDPAADASGDDPVGGTGGADGAGGGGPAEPAGVVDA